jgi:hypothetical protein
MGLKELTQTMNNNYIYLRNKFEKIYYEKVNPCDYSTRFRINQTFTLLGCMIGGSLFSNFIEFTWKSYADWSYVELATIGYFLFNGGNYGGEKMYRYFEHLSITKPIPIAYVGETLEGSSYANPVDLTSSTEEESEETTYSEVEEEEEEEEDDDYTEFVSNSDDADANAPADAAMEMKPLRHNLRSRAV